MTGSRAMPINDARSSRGWSGWLLVPAALLVPVVANALWLFLTPHESGRLTAWLSTWGVALLDGSIALILAAVARGPMARFICVVLVAGAGAASWFALALLLMAP